MTIPASTYRIQLSAKFTFEDLLQVLDYLSGLGVSTVYASPIFQARKGSTHGYDVLDPFTINQEIGNLENFRNIFKTLRQHNMTWIQDIVPNHMAFDGKNPWLRDIFELGSNSEYFNFFDIDWKESGKVMAPILGAPIDEILKKGELKLELHGNEFSFNYFQHRYPASAQSYSKIMEWAEIGKWMQNFEDFSGNDMQWEDAKIGFFREVKDDHDLNERIHSAIEKINDSPEKMKEVLELQYFKLVHWQTTEQEINYRRFFTINELLCLRMEDPKVFDTYHYYLNELYEQGIINGLRIDHIDGLYYPAGYLRELQKLIGGDHYLIVEKIQETEEDLPPDWPVQGSTGYDFLAQVNHLFTKQGNESLFTQGYKKIAPELPEYKKYIFQKKHFILKEKMGGELENLFQLLKHSDLLPKEGESSEEIYKEALSVFLSSFPLYRIYPESFPLSALQQEIIEATCLEAVENAPEREDELIYLRSIFRGETGKDPEKMLNFLQRSQQFTGPLAAKGVEDTVFYIYNRLISHNEVGDSPGNFGISTDEFHKRMQRRQDQFPLSLNATATHDTKRGEDARMRLNVLSELPQEWFRKVREWQQINEPLREIPGVPDTNEEYFIYQTILGGFPFEQAEMQDFVQRLRDYLQKALREAKLHSQWEAPNEEYESAVLDFVSALLEHQEFRKSFDPFQEKIAHYGALKSLGQTLIKITAPGIPDIYQGTELWELSFVDPDNRRPVAYDIRKLYLVDLYNFEANDLKKKLKLLRSTYHDGKIKMFLLNRALSFRKKHKELFEKGEYLPLSVTGKHSEKIIAYARHLDISWVLIVAPVLVTPLYESKAMEPKETALDDLMITLPKNAPNRWRNCLGGGEISTDGELELKNLLNEFPVALLTNII